MTLAELITALEAADPNQIVAHGFTNPHSYRGDYMDLAFEPATDVTVADMLADARSALGTTFEGYKGGDFTMNGYSDCWLAEYGNLGETLGPLLVRLMLAASAVVSPPPATRADAWHEAADVLAALDPVEAAIAGEHAWADAAALLRRLAAETPQPEPATRDEEPGNSNDALIEEYLRFLRGQGPEPDLSDLAPTRREAITGQFEIVKALADRDPNLPSLDRDPVARRLGLHEGPKVEARQQADTETQAHPPRHRWSVETRDDDVDDQWAPGTPITDRNKAVERYEHVTRNWPTWKDGTPVQRRLVRTTTTYTVEQHGAVPVQPAAADTREETDRA